MFKTFDYLSILFMKRNNDNIKNNSLKVNNYYGIWIFLWDLNLKFRAKETQIIFSFLFRFKKTYIIYEMIYKKFVLESEKNYDFNFQSIFFNNYLYKINW